MTEVTRARPSLPAQTPETAAPHTRRVDAPRLDRAVPAAPPNAVAEAMRPPDALPMSLVPTPELKALTASFQRAVEGGIDAHEMAALRVEAARIDDVVQKDLAESALDKIEAQAPLTDAHRAMLGDRLIDGYTDRAVAILAHPTLAKLREDPTKKKTHDELAMLLVRYTNDPVFLATIEEHVTASGGVTNAHQMAVGDDHPLYRVDEYFGQCNETSARTREIFEGLEARLGGMTLSGFDVTERSTVLLAYGLVGDGPGDHHFLYGVDVPGAGTLYLDPWVDQRADVDSVKTPAAYKASRDEWDAFHDYSENRAKKTE